MFEKILEDIDPGLFQLKSEKELTALEKKQEDAVLEYIEEIQSNE